MTSTAQFASSIQTLHYFDILAPAPQTSFKGTLVGGVFATRKCRRVSIEVHRVPLHPFNSNGNSNSNVNGAASTADCDSDDVSQSHAQVCYIRILKRTKSTLKKSFSTRNKRLDSALEDKETEYGYPQGNGKSGRHFLHKNSNGNDNDDSDSESQSSHSVATSSTRAGAGANANAGAIQSPFFRMEEQMVNASFVHLDPIDRHGQPLPPSPHSVVTSPTSTFATTHTNNNNPRHSPQSHHLTTLDEGREISTETMSSLSTTSATTRPSPLPTETTTGATATSTTPPPTPWKTQYKIPLAEFHVMHTQKDTCTVSFQCGHDGAGKSKRQTRVFVFATEEEAQSFGTCIQSQVQLVQTHIKESFLKVLSGLQLTQHVTVEEFRKQPLEFLVEIVGAQNLARSDLIGSSDPYVKVVWGEQMIHKTKYISDNVDPVWTIQTKSLFVFSTTGAELFNPYHRLTFLVYDYDAVTKDTCLGMASISAKTIFQAQEERMEIALVPHVTKDGIAVGLKNKEVQGTLAVRIRKASPSDLEFMSRFKLKEKEYAVFKSIKHGHGSAEGHKQHPTTSTIKSILEIKKKPFKENDVRIIKYKVRPTPDPRNKERTWMSNLELEQEYLKASRDYTYIGSGTIGKLWLEVLGCSNLPNLDVGGFLGNKTDAFVTLVYEDCVAKTDVIDDCLNPKWMPWTDRAFCFHMKYPSSPLFLGVSDFDEGIIGSHDLVGKATLDLCKFVPDTEYTLDLQLWDSIETTTRARMGSIKIRVRLEIEDQRKFLLESLKMPPTMHVNSDSKKEHECIEGACRGAYDVEEYQLGTIMSLYGEIYEVIRVVHYIKEGLATMILWRGTYPVTIYLPNFIRKNRTQNTETSDYDMEAKTGFLGKYTYEKELSLPMNSVFLFITGVCLVENPSLFPSILFLFLGRLMVATMQWKNSHPSPWNRCKSLNEILRKLYFGCVSNAPQEIYPYEKDIEQKEFDERWEEKITKVEERAKKQNQEWYDLCEKMNEDISKTGGYQAAQLKKSDTKATMNPIEMLKPYLYPWQQYLFIAAKYMRFTKRVILWEEPYLSFWITIACFFLAGSLYVIPLDICFLWSCRIAAWGFLGPWMKLVDMYGLVEEDEEKDEQKRQKQYEKMRREVRLENEKGAKLKAMKEYLFGQYVTEVPLVALERFNDVPLPSSSSQPFHKQRGLTLAEAVFTEGNAARNRQTGQHLEGVMIPTIDHAEETEAPTGQVAKNPSRLGSLELGARTKNDTATVNALKLGSLVGLAGIITAFLTPLLMDLVKFVSLHLSTLVKQM